MAGLVTGEAVLLDLRPARLASRLLAALLDAAILLALLLAGVFLLSRVPLDLDPAAGAAAGTVLFVGVLVGYPTLWESLTRGRTPGKMAVGLRVVRDDGGPVRFRQSLTRALTLLVDLPTLYLPSLLVMVLSDRGKRLGDVLAGTFVVSERVPAAAVAAPLPMPPPLAAWAAGLDLSRLPDDLALTVRQFLGRAPSLAPAAREQVGARLVTAVAAATSPPPPPGTPGWAYLAAVLAERRRRAEARGGPPGPVGRTGPAERDRWVAAPGGAQPADSGTLGGVAGPVERPGGPARSDGFTLPG